MTLNETIMQLVMLAEHPAMPKGFQPTLDKIIKALSELEPEPHWIPCSKRMPEEAGTYTCTCADAGRLMVTQIKWQPKLKSWNLSGARAYWKVLAWQPLPTPYQPKEETE